MRMNSREDAMAARWWRFGMAAGWGAVIGWAPMAIMYAVASQSPDGRDFGMFYAAAETLRFSPHADIYSQQTLTATVLAHGGCDLPLDGPYPYQPLFALLLQPLTRIPCHTAATVWLVLNFGLWFGISALYTVQTWRRYGAVRALVVAMMAAFFLPVISGIVFGQVHLVLLGCIVAGIMMVSRDHEYAGGAALGFGVALKYFPAILVFYYLLRGRWRVAGSAALVTVALVILEGLVVGPRTLTESVGAAGYAMRFGAMLYQDGNWMRSLPGGVPIAYLAGISFVSIVIWLQWRNGHLIENEALGAAWAITSILLLSPLIWWSYMTWLLPALMLCLDIALRYVRRPRFGRGWRSVARRWWPLATLAVVYGLLLVPQYNKGAANYRVSAAATLLLWLLCGAFYLWSAGVRLPWPPLSLGSRRRSPVVVEPSGASGAASASP
jgi:glycosyl transferase family 87